MSIIIIAISRSYQILICFAPGFLCRGRLPILLSYLQRRPLYLVKQTARLVSSFKSGALPIMNHRFRGYFCMRIKSSNYRETREERVNLNSIFVK